MPNYEQFAKEYLNLHLDAIKDLSDPTSRLGIDYVMRAQAMATLALNQTLQDFVGVLSKHLKWERA